MRSGRFTAHGNTDPANRGLASAFTDRQNGESPWLAKTEGAATSGKSPNFSAKKAAKGKKGAAVSARKKL